jgi:hypothetical protein
MELELLLTRSSDLKIVPDGRGGLMVGIVFTDPTDAGRFYSEARAAACKLFATPGRQPTP